MTDVFSINAYSPSVQELCRQDPHSPEWHNFPDTNLAEKFVITEDDIPALLEIAGLVGKERSFFPSEYELTPYAVWETLKFFPAKQTLPAMIETLNHIEWNNEDLAHNGIDFARILAAAAAQNYSYAVPLLLTAAQEPQRHDATRLTLLKALNTVVTQTAEYTSQWQAMLFDELKELRIGYGNWYAGIISAAFSPAGTDLPPEFIGTIKRACLEGYVNLVRIEDAAKDKLKELAELDFEADANLLPLYKEFVAVDWIIRAFRTLKPPFPKQAINQTRKHWNRMMPAFIESVRNATSCGRFNVADCGSSALLALYFFAEFKAKEALPAVLDSLSLADDQLYDCLYGDSLSEELPGLVYHIIGNDFGFYQQKLCDMSTPIGVLECLRKSVKYLVADKSVSDADYFALLHKCLTAALQVKREEDSFFMSCLVCDACDAAQPDLLLLVREAFARDRVDTEVIREDDIGDDLSGKGRQRTPFRKSLPVPHRFFDAEKGLSQWVCYQHQPKTVKKVPEKPVPMSWSNDDEDSLPLPPASYQNAGRNDPCPCGSGKKYKVCCMKKR
ncbi:MAG: DUF1186 domain-containing protein [Planctomycetaceae bacterium]|nr:DUF1186 domain-containing protein [Planctomycetaceae bacterium]